MGEITLFTQSSSTRGSKEGRVKICFYLLRFHSKNCPVEIILALLSQKDVGIEEPLKSWSRPLSRSGSATLIYLALGCFHHMPGCCLRNIGPAFSHDLKTFSKQCVTLQTTPEKWDIMTRRWNRNDVTSSRRRFPANDVSGRIRLVMLDEVHLLNDASRGHTLEAVVTRMKTTMPQATT